MTQAPPEETRPAGHACPRCGAPAIGEQLVCLSCGERLSIAYRRPPGWRLPAAIVGAVALLAGIALAMTLVVVGDEAEEVARAPQPTQELTESAPPAPAPAETPEGEAETPEPPAPEPTESGSGDVESWPAGESGYTVILLSTATRDGAEGKAREAIDQGISAGVLESGNYSSLNPGFWVAYGGRFDDQDEAQREAERYASLGFAGAYVRFVSNSD